MRGRIGVCELMLGCCTCNTELLTRIWAHISGHSLKLAQRSLLPEQFDAAIEFTRQR